MHSNEQLAWYGSYATGLEEGGVAPDNATNKNHAPPAIRTEQWDAGARYAFTPALGLVAGAFDIEKPYVSGEEVNSGAVSEIPVAQVRLIIASVDYRLPVLPELSFDATLTSTASAWRAQTTELRFPGAASSTSARAGVSRSVARPRRCAGTPGTSPTNSVGAPTHRACL